MTSNRAFKLLWIEKRSQAHGPLKVRLTDEQLEALRACAKGVSLRFEKSEIVNALLEAGYAEKNIAGVVRVTEKGHQYLRTHGD
ncbi:MAG TPA: hypothetical protein VGA51_13795 [Casimicrobiaceae bacterium]